MKGQSELLQPGQSYWPANTWTSQILTSANQQPCGWWLVWSEISRESNSLFLDGSISSVSTHAPTSFRATLLALDPGALISLAQSFFRAEPSKISYLPQKSSLLPLTVVCARQSAKCFTCTTAYIHDITDGDYESTFHIWENRGLKKVKECAQGQAAREAARKIICIDCWIPIIFGPLISATLLSCCSKPLTCFGSQSMLTASPFLHRGTHLLFYKQRLEGSRHCFDCTPQPCKFI